MEFNETDIAIIGMNCRFPGINGIEAFESCLRSGKGLLDPQLKQGEGGNTRICINAVIDEIDQFDAELFGFTHQEARITDPQQRLFMQAVWEMLETSGYAPRHIDQTTGIFAGTSTSFYLLYHLLGQTNDIRQANDLQVMIGNDKDHLTSQIAYRLDVKGPTVTIQASCATSMVATHLACEALNSGQCDLAISGGVTLRLPSQKDYDFQSGGLLSEDGLIHAFDAEATGTVYSSGVATLLLKRAQDAINDGDQIHGLILGTAVTNDGAMRAGYTAPSVDGQVRALVEAYEIAGVDPADIAYVEAHGSGTPMGDRIELDALHQVFGQFSNRSVTPKSCVLGSVKTNIGHCEMASGAAGLIKTILSLRSSTLFPSLNFSVPAPELAQAQSPFYVNVSCKPWPQHRPRLAGVSSIGLGGTNAHTILKAYEPSQVAGTQTDHVGSELIVLSAREQDQLHAYQEALINSADRFSLKDIAHTLRVGREAHSLRKAVVLNSGQSLKDALHAASEVQATEKQFYLMLSPQVAFSSDEMNEFLQMMSERATEIADMSDNSDLLTRYDTLSRDQQEALTAQLILNFLHYLDVTPAAILLNADRSSAGALWSVVESFVAELPCFYRDKTAWIPFEGRSHFENLSKIAQQLETSEPYIFALGQALVINYDSDTNCINIGMDAYSISGQSPIEIFDYPIFSTDNLLRTRQLIEGLGHAWANGVRINWHQFPTQSDVCRVPLPSPQFLQRSYWIDQPDQTSVLEISKLPERAVQLGIVKMAPQEVFDSVKQIWEQAFGTEIDDDQINFFEMGGHSLMATQMISLLQERIGVNLPMSAFFEAPTIAGIAKACQNQQSHHQASNFQTLIQEPDQLNEPFALTDVQLAYWIGRRSSLPLGDVATHIYFEFDLPEFSLPLFEVAVNKVIARHPMLRAVIREDGMQQILAQVPVFKIQDIPADDINSIAYQSATKRLRSKMSHQVTDCSQWPLFDMCAVTTQTGHARLHVSFDLLIADAWSIELFMQEVSYHYRHPNADLPELGFSFRDHVMTTKQAEKSEAFDIARAYWETRLPELPMGPDLPLQTAPENLSGVKFVRRSQVMSSAVMSRLKQLASQHQLTMTGLLLSCFSIVLARWSREPHFCLNLTLFNRLMMHPDVNQVIGDFTTLNIMEIDLRGNDSFLMKAQRVQQQIWQDLDHRLFSGVQVSRRLSQRGEQAQDGIIPVVFTSLLNQDNVEWNEQDEALLGANDFYT
ncbi:hypothetical protein GOZ70_25990, partial [Vibrio parahaemolyticus]|nr:hypothetical protein [Vibrio parahaemolyticus]ELC3209713.1 hypothetical protein [Vibrio parahaemolyticus]